MKISKNRLYDFKVLGVILFVAILVFIASDQITQNKTKALKAEKYKIYAKNIKNEIKQALLHKQDITYSIALSYSKNKSLIDALKQNDPSLLSLKKFSKELANTTRLKNVWFQVITKEGSSFYRSWVDKRGDSIVDSRLDIQKMIEFPIAMNTISTGRFDMTFKSMVPIYDEEEFIGIFISVIS